MLKRLLFRSRRFLRKFLIRSLQTVAGIALCCLGLILLFRFVPVPGSMLMVIRWVEHFGNEAEWSCRYQWKPYSRHSPYVKKALILSEDQRFFIHWGFDLRQIRKAWDEGRGGSTITQQTAKNLFLWPGRSWIRKGLEAGFTVLLELLWTKQRILEVYMNIVELGPGIFGFEAAAKHYYHRPAERLNIQQSTLLVACMPNPLKWSPVRPTPSRTRKAARIQQMMRKYPDGFFAPLKH